jgi:hypothetical protein
MGLDCYLTAKKYVSNYSEKDKELVEYLKTAPVPKGKNWRVDELTLSVGYWRKANQIHKWFVDNVQGGKDDCKEYFVSWEQLKQLYAVVQAVLNDKTLAGDLLPTQGGFFFGDTSYDEYYFDDLANTIEILDAIFKNEELTQRWDFYYRASW